MGDRARCPACGCETSSLLMAFNDGEPCPYCGLPAAVAAVIEHYAAKGADEQLTGMAAQAEQRAAKAERELASLRARVNRALFELGSDET